MFMIQFLSVSPGLPYILLKVLSCSETEMKHCVRLSKKKTYITLLGTLHTHVYSSNEPIMWQQTQRLQRALFSVYIKHQLKKK